MAESGKRKAPEPDASELEARTKKPGLLPESQPSDSTLKSAGEDVEPSEADGTFKSALATLPPFQQWSSETIERLMSAVNEKYPEAEWQEESEWTRRLINAVLASNESWNWQRLKTCSNADYFSLPIHVSHKHIIIRLLQCYNIDSISISYHCSHSGFHTQ